MVIPSTSSEFLIRTKSDEFDKLINFDFQFKKSAASIKYLGALIN